MSDVVINTRHAPDRMIPRECVQQANAVRACRASPETVIIQIRRPRDITSVSLTFEEAKAFADAILAALPNQEGEPC